MNYHKGIKILITQLILLIAFSSCRNKMNVINDKLITPSRIGGINLGEKYETLLKIDEIRVKEVDLSNEMFKNNIKLWYGYSKDEFKVYAQRQKGGIGDIVHMIICKSEKHYTENGVHVGMTIQELRTIYPDVGYNLKGGMNEEIGFFVPSDLVLRNEHEFFMSHVILKLSTEKRRDTIISTIIVGTD